MIFLIFELLLSLCLPWYLLAGESFNGGTFLALAGKESVVIATDSRFSHHRFSSLLLGHHPRAVYRVGDKSIVGCYGLDADGELIMELLRGKVCNHLQSEVAAPAVARLLSNLLYEKSFYITPVIAGFELDGRPYLCSMDSLGAMTASRSFAVTGSATTQLHALCEALYVPDLDALQLVKLTERCLRLAFQRDILSGGDLKVVILTRDGLFVKEISFQDI